MKKFVEPTLEVESFTVEDVITVSGGDANSAGLGNCTGPVNPFGGPVNP